MIELKLEVWRMSIDEVSEPVTALYFPDRANRAALGRQLEAGAPEQHFDWGDSDGGDCSTSVTARSAAHARVPRIFAAAF